jgi:hypothetical protein
MTSPGRAKGFQAKWTDQDKADFQSIVEALRGRRQFDTRDIPPPPKAIMPKERPLLLLDP